MRNLNIIKLIVSIIFIFIPINIMAFDIGQLNAFYEYSDNEPFYAEIVIRNLGEEDPGNLRAEVLSQRDFETADLPYGEYEQGYEVDVIDVDKTSALLVVTNDASIPYNEIALLVEVRNAQTGEAYTRKFSTLQSPAPPQPEEAPTPTPLELEETSSVAPPATVSTTVPVTNALTMDLVQGDTLENVGEAILLAYYRSQSVSLEQVMTAVRRNNVALLDPNHSYQLIPTGRALIPSYEQVLEQSYEEARAEIDTYYRTYFSENSWKAAFAPSPGRVRLDTSDSQESSLARNSSSSSNYDGELSAQIDSLLARRNAIIEAIQSLDEEVFAYQSQLDIYNQQLEEYEALLREARSSLGIAAIISGFISDVVDVIRDNPLITIAVVLGVALIILLIRYSLHDDEYHNPYDDTYDDFNKHSAI